MLQGETGGDCARYEGFFLFVGAKMKKATTVAAFVFLLIRRG